MSSIIPFNIDRFYVVSHSPFEEGALEQISVGFKSLEKALDYKESDFCKSRWPNAFIMARVEIEKE